MRVRQFEPVDRPAIESFLARWNSLRVARLGAVEHPLEHPALIAEQDGVPVLNTRGIAIARKRSTRSGNRRSHTR
jgi:hypothetical protein